MIWDISHVALRISLKLMGKFTGNYARDVLLVFAGAPKVSEVSSKESENFLILLCLDLSKVTVDVNDGS